MADLEKILKRVEQVLERFEATLPQKPSAPDWKASTAFRWRKRGTSGFLQAVAHPHKIRLSDLQGIDEQIELVEQNTRQFIDGLTDSLQPVRFRDRQVGVRDIPGVSCVLVLGKPVLDH